MVDESGSPRKWVWVPSKDMLYKAGYVVREEGAYSTVMSDSMERFHSAEVHKKNPAKFDQAEDLASLSHLNEPSVLHNIKTRFDESLFYTYSGLFLLAVNPYRETGIYGEKKKREVMMKRGREGEPHIYVVANEAYRSMVANRESQSILITGESGAGKTENTKRVIEFLAYAGRTGESGRVVELLEHANPLLEAFGNAKTVRNDNSSRFGKFIQLKFRGGAICGARIESYLLEKTRVANASGKERGFHIFYYLLAGADAKQMSELGLVRDPGAYACLRDTTKEIEGVNDAEEYRRVMDAFGQLGIESGGYLRILAAILWLSNIELIESGEGCRIGSLTAVEHASSLLGIAVTDFLNGLLSPTIQAGGERVTHLRRRDEAASVVEGLMKTLYDELFGSLVEAINRRLDSGCDSYIGILDIAGFEIFDRNSFEQLCINYTNEKLQQFFNHHMFVLEQELYRAEEIAWEFIDFGLDLEPTIRAIESVSPIGILAYLDEECVMTWGSDAALLDKISSAPYANNTLGVPLLRRVPFKSSFVMKHYAGEVEYSVEGWLKKNRDVEAEELLRLINLAEILGGKVRQTEERCVKKGIFKTVAQAHRENLRGLMERLQKTQPHFVRCILPNLERDSVLFDRRLVLDQLRCNGVLEGIRISRLGYPNRLLYADFVARYSLLLGTETINEDELIDGKPANGLIGKAERIVKVLRISPNDYRLGRRRIFFRQGIIADIEERRELVIASIGEEIRMRLRDKIQHHRNNRDAELAKAASLIQRDAKRSLALLKSGWWRLFQLIAPLLDVNRNEEKKRANEEQMKELAARVARQEGDLRLSAGKIEELSLRLKEARAEVTACEAVIHEREALLGALREESRHVENENSLMRETVSAIGAEISELRSTVERMRKEETRLTAEVARKDAAKHELQKSTAETRKEVTRLKRLNREIAQEREKEADKAMRGVLEQLRLANEELDRERERRAVLTEKEANLAEKCRILRETIAEGEERLASEEEKRAEVAGRAKQLEHDLALERDENAAHNTQISKLRMELSDAQLEANNLERRCRQLEAQLKESNARAGQMNQEAARAHSVNKTLERHLQVLKTDLSTAQEALSLATQQTLNSPLPSKDSTSSGSRKLTEKCRVLESEIEALQADNLRLVQSKLDDLFNCESEFSAERSALRSEIRRLESENTRLSRELEAQQSGSEYSEDFTTLLENERNRAQQALARLVEQETTNVKLENEISGLRAELKMADEMLKAMGAAPVSNKDIEILQRKLVSVRSFVNSICNSFTQDFLRLLNGRDELIAELGTRLDGLQRKLAGAECAQRELADVHSRLEQTLRDAAGLAKDLDAAHVANSVAEQRIKELESHTAKLEKAYNAREEELERMRLSVSREAEQLHRLRELYTASLCESDKASLAAVRHSNEIAALERQNELASLTLESLKSANATLESDLDSLRQLYATSKSETTRLARELGALHSSYDDLLRRHSEMSACRIELPAPFTVEKIVSSFVADEEMLRALSWKRVVAEKCQDCVQRRLTNSAPTEISPESSEIVRLNSEIGLLNLKLMQSERVNEENQRLVESLKACISLARRPKRS